MKKKTKRRRRSLRVRKERYASFAEILAELIVGGAGRFAVRDAAHVAHKRLAACAAAHVHCDLDALARAIRTTACSRTLILH